MLYKMCFYRSVYNHIKPPSQVTNGCDYMIFKVFVVVVVIVFNVLVVLRMALNQCGKIKETKMEDGGY